MFQKPSYVSLIVLAALAAPLPAWAQVSELDISARPATKAVLELARQAQVQIIAPGRRLRNVTTNPVKGRLSVPVALDAMLRNTGLAAVRTQGNVYVIQVAQLAPTSGARRAQPAPAAPHPAAPATAASEVTVTDVIVTARRREERLQDVPVAVTAITSATLQRRGITGLLDIQRAAPSLNISQSAGGGRNIPLFTIRGQRQGDTLASVDPSVGLYVGDQLFRRAYGLDQVVFDLSSVEVLKGPQGTLFGLNTTGGNIILRPNLPTHTFEASLMGGVGDYSLRELDGYVNLPLSDWAALRLAGTYKRRDGYITNVLNGQHDQDLDGYGLRATLKLDPTDRLQSIFTGDYLHNDTNGTGWKLNYLQPTNAAGTALTSIFSPVTGYGAPALNAALALENALPFYQVAADVYSNARTAPAWNVANTTSYKINDVLTFKNILGYRYYFARQVDDVDGSPLQLLEYGNQQKGREYSEEFQLLGDTPALNWIVGGYVGGEHVKSVAFTTGLISPKLQGIQTPYKIDEKVTNSTKAVFGSATKKLDNLVDGLSLTLGGRYTWDTRHAAFGQTLNMGYVPGQATGLGTKSPGQICAFNPKTDPTILLPQYHFNASTCLVDLQQPFGEFTYTTSLDWKFAPDKLVYIAHRKGYRAGGFNTRSTLSAQLTPFQPETVYDVELGTKLDWRFDNGMFLRTNAALYRQFYQDIQRQVSFVTPSGGILASVANAAQASVKGAELETTFIPSRLFEIDASAAYTEPKYDKYISGGVDISQTATYAGVSKWQLNVAGRFNVPTPQEIGDLALQLSYYYQSRFAIQDSNDFQPAGQTPGYGLLNGRIELNNVAGRPVNVDFFVTNILNRKYSLGNYALQYTFGFASYIAGPPRMYGVEVRYNFQ